MGKHSKKRRVRRLMYAKLDGVVQIQGIGWIVENMQRHDSGVSFELTQGTSSMKAFIGREVLADLVEATLARR